jgi:hypothetical protein
MNQERLGAIKRAKQQILDSIGPHTLTANINANNFRFRIDGGREVDVSRKIRIKPEIPEIRVGTTPTPAVTFFRNIGCLESDNSIDMMKLNQIKQYLDMIKDGTSSKLLKELQIFSFTRDPAIIPNVTYPNTLDEIKEYFNQHYKKAFLILSLVIISIISGFNLA